MRQPGEPSVDEILSTIKKVIARDNRAATAGRGAQDAGATQPAAAGRNADVPAEDVLDLAMSAQFLDPEDQDFAWAESPDDSQTAPLVAPEARAAMRESLAALAMMAKPGASPQIVRSGETSLEELTRELLRPALAEWLDRHLPAMVERLVAVEIARIVGKRP
jgi:cell pole-organizing protein PopZ